MTKSEYICYRELGVAIVQRAVEDYTYWLNNKNMYEYNKEHMKDNTYWNWKTYMKKCKSAGKFLKTKRANWLGNINMNVNIKEELERRYEQEELPRYSKV